MPNEPPKFSLVADNRTREEAIDSFETENGMPVVAIAIVRADGAVRVWKTSQMTMIEQLDWLGERFSDAAMMAYQMSAKGNG